MCENQNTITRRVQRVAKAIPGAIFQIYRRFLGIFCSGAQPEDPPCFMATEVMFSHSQSWSPSQLYRRFFGHFLLWRTARGSLPRHGYGGNVLPLAIMESVAASHEWRICLENPYGRAEKTLGRLSKFSPTRTVCLKFNLYESAD